jgi:hypothetical protein
MNGGSMDYLYLKVQDVADGMKQLSSSPHRQRFAEHLQLVAVALKDVEYCDSGDTSENVELRSIEAVFDDCQNNCN